MQLKKQSTTKSDLKLSKKLNKQNKASYFNVYQTNKNGTICLVSNHKNKLLSSQIIQKIINRINQCGEIFTNQCAQYYKNYVDMCEGFVQKQKAVFLVYQGIKQQYMLTNMKGRLQLNQILNLSIFLVNFVIKLKQSSIYFGSFSPERIVCHPNENCYILGAQFFQKKSSTAQFLKNNQEIKQQLLNSWIYQPPQVFDNSASLTYSSDLFVIACIIYQIITGEYPYPSKQSLLQKQVPTKHSHSQITKLIHEKILQPSSGSRVEPEQILRLLQLERSRNMFNTCKLQINPSDISAAKHGFFDNFQEFIMKCTTETQGWFLHYCENCPEKPNQKYLDQILNKIAKKSQKINKITNLIQKCALKSFKEQNSNQKSSNSEDNTYSIVKMGILIFNFLRKLPFQTIQPFQASFSKICTKIVSKKAENKVIPIIYKLIAFKISLQTKFQDLSGNFHVRIQNYSKLSTQAFQYLSQYSLKIVNYLKAYSQKDAENIKQFQVSAINILCDQLYDSISFVLYGLMAMKKDRSLKICQRQLVGQQILKRIDNTCSQIVKSIGKLCSYNTIFGCHELYSVNSDYYQYQEEICLIYQPIVTSYQYFYIDKNQYKGLSLPKNYSKTYGNNKDFFQDFSQDSKYNNRKHMLNRLASIRDIDNQQVQKKKSSTNSHKAYYSSSNNDYNKSAQTTKSQGGDSIQKKKQNNDISTNLASQTQRKRTDQKEIDFFNHFMTQTPKIDLNKSPQEKKDQFGSNSNNQAKNQSQPTCASWIDVQDEIISYQSLKKAQKIKNKFFQKPQVDEKIIALYDDICKGLKLQQLIKTLGKNKKIIVDPNQVLFQKVIGSGSAGQVYIGKHKQNIVAIKKVKIASNPNALKQFQRQVLTYIKIKYHPSLVSIVGLTKFNQDYFLLTQFCDGGSLFDLLHKKVNEIPLSWSQRISIALDIAKGMEVLHFMNPPVIHRDLKSLNVFMLNKNNLWVGKVADFGLSRSPDADMMTSALGTLHWMAPELLKNQQYSLKVDVYSFAVVLWQICTRRTPYHNLANQMAIVKHVAMDKGRPLLQLINPGCPVQLIDLMKRCWDEQPQNRPYFPEIVTFLSKLKK